MHRWCASLPKAEFLKLKESEPFYCPHCCSNIQAKAIEELRGTVHALAVQMEELRCELLSTTKSNLEMENGRAVETTTDVSGCNWSYSYKPYWQGLTY